jgi:glycosyltransferase involved in cell wall biosynthesis
LAKGIFVLSEIDRQQVLDAYHPPAEHMHILPHVPPRYIFTTEVPAGFDSRYPLPAKFLFYPAQFWEHKNHKNILRAMALLKPELPDLKLVLAGSKKNAYESVVRLAEGLDLADDVLFLGYVPDADMPELYRRARALIFATYYGPTNIPPLEAMVTGCPMALAETTCMPDKVGDAALVFDPDSVDEMAACIKRLWTDDRLCAELAAKGKIYVGKWKQEHFNQRMLEIISRTIP